MRNPFKDSPSERLRRIHAALDWLEENPECHIKNAMARSSWLGRHVSPFSDAAQCFCVTGRIAHEIGPFGWSPDPGLLVHSYIEPFGVKASDLIKINDFATATRSGMKEAIWSIRAMFPPRPETVK